MLLIFIFIYSFIYLLLLFLFIFFGTRDTFLGSLINKKEKEQYLFKIEMLSNNINLYYHCFYQFSKSLLNEN